MTRDESKTQDDDGREVVDERSVRLTWTDPETEDRISVEVDGSQAFLSGLLELGFEPGFEPGRAQDAGARGAGPADRTTRATRGTARGSARARSSPLPGCDPDTEGGADTSTPGARGRADDAA